MSDETPAVPALETQTSILDEDATLGDLAVGIKDQDELEQDIGRQADRMLQEQADERDKKRLEKTQKDKDRLLTIAGDTKFAGAGHYMDCLTDVDDPDWFKIYIGQATVVKNRVDYHKSPLYFRSSRLFITSYCAGNRAVDTTTSFSSRCHRSWNSETRCSTCWRCTPPCFSRHYQGRPF